MNNHKYVVSWMYFTINSKYPKCITTSYTYIKRMEENNISKTNYYKDKKYKYNIVSWYF